VSATIEGAPKGAPDLAELDEPELEDAGAPAPGPWAPARPCRCDRPTPLRDGWFSDWVTCPKCGRDVEEAGR
jgi:hypothetical protein